MEPNTNLPMTAVRASNWDFRNILNRKTDLVRQASLFSEIPPEHCAQVVALALERNYQRAKTIYFEGDAVHQIYILISGCVKVIQFSPNGSEVILRLIGPGECFGLESAASIGHRSTVRTVMRSRALTWEAKQFEAVAERFPVLRRNISRELQRYLNQLEERYREISTHKVASRLSSELLRLLHRIGQQTDSHIEIALSRRDLAQLIGTTIFTVSRLLCQWEILGIVKSRREAVVVLDVRALEEVARVE